MDALNQMPAGLTEFVEKAVVPRYAAFDKAHREDHARSVISRALDLAAHYEVSQAMVYVAAACHDLGLEVDRKTHHLESGRIIREMPELRAWFSEEQIVRRTVQYGFAHYPELAREGHWQRTLEHLHEKYDYGGYLKLWIPESPNAAQLEALRQLIHDETRLRQLFERIYREERGE